MLAVLCEQFVNLCRWTNHLSVIVSLGPCPHVRLDVNMLSNVSAQLAFNVWLWTHMISTAHVSRGIISNITLFSKWVQGLVSFSHSNSPLDSRLWYQACATITWSMCRCQATRINKSFSKCIQKSYLLIAVNSGAALSPHSSSPLHISYTVTSYFQIQIDLFVDNQLWRVSNQVVLLAGCCVRGWSIRANFIFWISLFDQQSDRKVNDGENRPPQS